MRNSGFTVSMDAKAGRHVDFDLKASGDIVATGDGVVIDDAGKVVNFLNCIVSRFEELDVN